ncbi:MAG: hypothetical protein HY080_08735 [Gammaproteobacteria bacterium]|nr:hypothetical protein [Gammaproteobacteria bacterium]
MRYIIGILIVNLAACAVSNETSNQKSTGRIEECKDSAASLLKPNRNGELTTLEGSERRIEEIDFIFSCNRTGIYKVYTESLLTQKALSGKIKFKINISKNGGITDIVTLATDIKNDGFITSLITYVKTLKFNRAKNDGKYIYTFGFYK